MGGGKRGIGKQTNQEVTGEKTKFDYLHIYTWVGVASYGLLPVDFLLALSH